MDPEKLDKYLYIEKTPTWLVRGLSLFGIFSWALVIWGSIGAIDIDPFFTWFVTPILTLFTLYTFLSLGLDFLYRRFNIYKHVELVGNFWRSTSEPSVDIFLPICGEETSVLENTWKNVAQLDYQNKKIYVLDDSKDECETHEMMAHRYGFTYFSRPNKGEMKKAGNLKYAYQRTQGEFIAIFDADFAPHRDFLRELLPYTSDQRNGIIQSPQYFEATRGSYRRAPLSYAAAYQEEFFYRMIQVAKDRVNGAICCGSNAIYRRAALESIGGPRQVDASEDSRTGFALLQKGWVTRYVPIILAVGICPDTVYAYYHQQHRWCRGRSELILSREFITARVPFMIKLCNISSFLSFLIRPFEVLLSFELLWTLFLYNKYISIGNAGLFYPYMLYSLAILPLSHIIRVRKEVFYASVIRIYASAHALLSVAMGRTVGWIATNAKHSTVSSAFRHTMLGVSIYFFIFLTSIALGLRTGALHIFNYNYYSIQFWIFWNIAFSGALLWQMYRTLESVKRTQTEMRSVGSDTLILWQFKTAGLYTLLVTGTFFAILYL